METVGTRCRENGSMNCRYAARTGILALFLAGCAGEMIRDAMLPLIGHRASYLFEKLGFPDAEDTIAGRRFYVWASETTGSQLVPHFNTGTIRGKHGTSTFGYTTFHEQPYHRSCRFRVFVDSEDRITAYDLDGNEGGCSALANKLDR